MTWDPAFNWSSRSSFNGEARKYSILTSIISELNDRADVVSLPNIPEVNKGETLNHVRVINTQLDVVLRYYYDQVNDDGTQWTLGKLETEIGFSRPDSEFGNLFGPTWIDWNYQAIELLTNTVNRSDYWSGTLGNSGAFQDSLFNIRWSFFGTSLITPTVNTISKTFLWKAGGSGVQLRQERIKSIKDYYVEFDVTYDQFQSAIVNDCKFGMWSGSYPFFEVHETVDVLVLGSTYSGDYSVGTWKVEHRESTGRIYVYFNGGLMNSISATAGMQTPLIYSYNGRVILGRLAVKYNNGDEIAIDS